jgi:hypothetical protein
MMWGAERYRSMTQSCQRTPGQAVNLHAMQALLPFWRRHDPRKTLGKHGFSRPWRPTHEEVVTSGRDSNGNFCQFCSQHHLSKIAVGLMLISCIGRALRHWLQCGLIASKPSQDGPNILPAEDF